MNTTPTRPVRTATDRGVATITLHRPDSLNAMNEPLMAGLRDALETVAGDETVRVVVLTGSGRAFCAGADLAEVAEEPDDAMSGNDVFSAALRSLVTCPVPTIARVNGPAAGGGFGLAVACDITIAAESAFFVATFGPLLGIVPDLGATWSIPRRVGRARALGISLLGERIPATQAADWGLIWSAVPDDQLDAEIERVTEVLRRSSPSAATRTRDAIDEAFDNSFGAQLDLELEHQAVLIPLNMAEGAKAFLEKRDPVFDATRG